MRILSKEMVLPDKVHRLLTMADKVQKHLLAKFVSAKDTFHHQLESTRGLVRPTTTFHYNGQIYYYYQCNEVLLVLQFYRMSAEGGSYNTYKAQRAPEDNMQRIQIAKWYKLLKLYFCNKTFLFFKTGVGVEPNTGSVFTYFAAFLSSTV